MFGLLLALLTVGCAEDPKDKEEVQEEVTIDQLSEQIDNFGGTADEFYQRAQLYFQDGALQNAADDVLMALRRDTSRIEFYHLLSDVQLNGFQSRQALQTLEFAANRAPEDRLTLLKLMELQLLLRQYPQALGTSQRLLLLDPQDQETFFLRGLLFKEQQMDSLAIVNFQRAVDLDPSMTDGFIILGDLHEKVSDPLAEAYYENAVRSNPDHVNALHALAFYQQNHDKVENALANYDKIIELDKGFQPALINKGILLLERDSLAAAKESLEAGLALDSSFVIALYYLGITEDRLGDKEAARSRLQKAIDIDPEYQAARDALKAL
jgi:tetratricopeptide (TPR) repeat protein